MLNDKSRLIMFLIIVLIGLVTAESLAMCLNMRDNYWGYQGRLCSPVIDSNLKDQVILELIVYFNPNLTAEKQLLICKSIMDQANQFHLEPFLVAGVIAAESSFRPNVVSRCQARGLMQISSTVSKMMRVNNPFDIQQNIYAGTRYLKMLRQQFANEELALAAYNAGPTRVARLQRIPDIRETVHYVKKVLQYRADLSKRLCIRVKDLMNKLSINMIAWECDNSEEIGRLLSSAPMARMSGANCDGCEISRKIFMEIA